MERSTPQIFAMPTPPTSTSSRGGDEETFSPALYLSRFPLRRGDGLSGNAGAGRDHRGRCQQRERRSSSQADDLQRPRQSDVVDWHLGPARKFPEHSHRLSAARRTSGLDGRRRSFLANGKLQLRHRCILAESSFRTLSTLKPPKVRLPMFPQIHFRSKVEEPKGRRRGTKAWLARPAGAMPE